MSTRGAHAWVRKTPTGLPDWTSSVSSSAEAPQLADDGVERRPRARRPARPAVDDQVVGPLGDLGVEVVHEHPQGRLLLPAAAGQPMPAARERARTGGRRARGRTRGIPAAGSSVVSARDWTAVAGGGDDAAFTVRGA